MNFEFLHQLLYTVGPNTKIPPEKALKLLNLGSVEVLKNVWQKDASSFAEQLKHLESGGGGGTDKKGTFPYSNHISPKHLGSSFYLVQGTPWFMH